MAPEDAAVGVELIEHDVFEAFEELHPLRVVGQDGRMEHVRVGQHDVPGGSHRTAGVGGGVAVVGERANVRAESGDQAVQLVELVLRQRLRGEQVERTGRTVAQDGAEDGAVIAERLAAGCGCHDHRVASRERVLDGLGLVGVGASYASPCELGDEVRVHTFGPISEARGELVEAAHRGLGGFGAKLG